MNFKYSLLLIAFLTVFCSCGARDDKNQVENYPTYDDTSRKADAVNDSSNASQHGEGNLRHNVDANENGR
jgi:hypothetical protein